MKRIIILQIMTFFIFLVTISCNKEKDSRLDFRKKYLGEYQFTVRTYFWSWAGGSSERFDTVVGTVRIFNPEDALVDLKELDDEGTTDFESRVTIEIKNNEIITPVIRESGAFDTTTGYHYFNEGQFRNDSLIFSVRNLGGLGSGKDYYVRGKKNQ